jgi:hypothetical protein
LSFLGRADPDNPRAVVPPVTNGPPSDGRHVLWFRVLLSGSLSLLFLAQLGSFASYAGRGEPSYAEAVSVLRSDGGTRMAVDLHRIPDRGGERAVPLPVPWLPSPDGRSHAAYLCLIDGSPLLRVDPSIVPRKVPGPITKACRGLRRLRRGSLCRSLLVLREDSTLWPRIIWARTVTRRAAVLRASQ